jgi:hypothetical protein
LTLSDHNTLFRVKKQNSFGYSNYKYTEQTTFSKVKNGREQITPPWSELKNDFKKNHCFKKNHSVSKKPLKWLKSTFAGTLSI